MTRYGPMLDDLVAGTLGAEAFDHRAHVGVAYEAVRKHGAVKAMALLSEGIAGLATKAGAPDKFNATITFAFVSVIAERMATGSYADAEDFLSRNDDLLTGAPLLRLFSVERLNSALAREVPLLPDRLAAG